MSNDGLHGYQRFGLSAGTVRLLELDPDLGENLNSRDRDLATQSLVVPMLVVEEGEWDPPALDANSLGLIVLDGLLVRRLQLGSMPFAELLGPGDILRPWEEGLAPVLFPALSRWKVLTRTRVATLDHRANALIGRWPALNAAVAARIMRRSRLLSYSMAAQHFYRVDDRLTAALWRMALMWGRVRPDGIVIPLPLSHQMLAEIVCARRPSVTQAIGLLEREGRLRRTSERHYVLIGDPPQWGLEEEPVAAAGVPAEPTAERT